MPIKLSLLNPANWFGSNTGGGSLQRRTGAQFVEPLSSIGTPAAPVNFDTAMQLSAFWASARLWSEVISSIPCYAETWDGDRWVYDPDHFLNELFSGSVNRYQNRLEFFETFALNHVVYGNAYALIRRNDAGEVVGLLPLNTPQVQPELLRDESVVYHYYHENGVDILASENVWHWKMFGNGLVGLSPLGYARYSVGAGLAGDIRTSTLMKNASKPSGFLTIDRALTPEQREQVRESFKGLQERTGDSISVLEAGFDFKRVALSAADIQLLESRRFQVEDVARFMDVPSVLINDTQNSTAWGSGISEIIRGWYKKSVRHRVNSLQASMVSSLVPFTQQRRTRIRHDFSDLLKMDRKERIETNAQAIQTAQMTPAQAIEDDGRKAPDDEKLNRYYFNSSIVSVDQVDDVTGRRPNARIEMTENEG